MTTPTEVYYNDAPIDETDYPELATKFKIAYELVFRCVEALRETGEVPIMAFSGTTRERVRALSEVLVTTSPDELEEPAEVVCDTKDEEKEVPERPTAEDVAFVKMVYEKNKEVINPSDDEEPSAGEENDELVDHAATALMQSFSDPKGSFLIDLDGCCSINPANPPTIQESYIAISHILKLKQLGEMVDDKSSWMRGSAIDALEDLHGENFSISQICEDSELNYNTTYQAVHVFKAFRKKDERGNMPKRFKVPFSNHQEAFFSKISDDKKVDRAFKRLILQKSESHKLGSKSVRALCSIAKTMAPDDTVIRNIRSEQQAKDLIAAYRAAKAQFVILSEEGWCTFSDAVDAKHEGKVVLNLKELTATAGNIVSPIKRTSAPKYEDQ